jgi:4'-phosphopantetheinyl transferase EntD
VLEQLLPANVVSVEVFEDRLDESVFPGEEDLIADAVENRRREFITARRCAREALARLGYPPAPIRSGPKREPKWPSGVVGSITHTNGFRAAAVALRGAVVSIGVDTEQNSPLPDGIEERIALAAESEMLTQLTSAFPATHWDRILFSAKESIYKAWYPLTGRWLGFENAHLIIDPAGTFLARLLVDYASKYARPPLGEIRGRFTVSNGFVATAVIIPPM